MAVVGVGLGVIKSHGGTFWKYLPIYAINSHHSGQSEWQGPGLFFLSLGLHPEAVRISWRPWEIHIRECVTSSPSHHSFDPQSHLGSSGVEKQTSVRDVATEDEFSDACKSVFFISLSLCI